MRRQRCAQSESRGHAPGQHPSLPRQLLALPGQASCCQYSVGQVPHSKTRDPAVPLTQRAADAAGVHTPGAEQLQVNGSWRPRAGAPTVRWCSNAGLSMEALGHNMLRAVPDAGPGLFSSHRMISLVVFLQSGMVLKKLSFWQMLEHRRRRVTFSGGLCASLESCAKTDITATGDLRSISRLQWR